MKTQCPTPEPPRAAIDAAALGALAPASNCVQPPAGAPRVPLFGGEMLAALVSDADGEKKLSVYLAKPSAKQIAKKLGVTRIDEYADTDNDELDCSHNGCSQCATGALPLRGRLQCYELCRCVG